MILKHAGNYFRWKIYYEIKSIEDTAHQEE